MDNNELVKQTLDPDGNPRVYWHKSLLHMWESNPRKISDKNELNLAADIKLNGIKDNFEITPDGMIIDGNHRFIEGNNQNIEWYPVHINKITDPSQIWEIAFRGNGEYAHFDPDLLSSHIEEFEGKINTSILPLSFEEKSTIDDLLGDEEDTSEITDNTDEEQTQEDLANDEEAPKTTPVKKEKKSLIVTCPMCNHTWPLDNTQ